MLARKSLLHFLNTLVGAMVGVVALKLIALFMGDVIFGQVGYALGLTGVLFSVMQFGLPKAHKKRMSEGEDPADRLATYMTVQVVVAVAFVLLIAAAIAFRIYVQGSGFRSTTLLTLIVITAYRVVGFWMNLAEATFVSQREIAREQFTEFINNLVRTFSAIAVALTYAAVAKDAGPFAGLVPEALAPVADLGPEVLGLTWVLGFGAAAATSGYYIVRDYQVGSFSWEALRSYWDFARPVYLSDLVQTAATGLDRVMLGYFWGGAAVGVYFGADRIVSVVKSASFALGVVLLPTVSSLSTTGDEDRIASVTGQAHRYTAMVVLPMVLFIAVFAAPIIHLLLSDQFLRGAPTLAVLAFYTLFAVAARPYNALIGGMDRPRLLMKVGLVAAVTNVGLNVVLIPADIKSLGITLFGLKDLGAAIATLASAFVSYVLNRRIARRIAPLPAQWGALLRQLAAGAVMIAALLLLDETVTGLARWYHLLLFGPLGAVVYFGALRLMGGLTDDDIRFFLDTVHPMEMVGYIRTELLGDGD